MHDFQLAVSIEGTAKAIGYVGKPVLMQRPGHHHHRRHGNDRRQP